jgi:outer membrane protein assembly factor BamB
MLAANRVYIVNRAGVLNCADAENGEVLWQLRLEGDIWASPVVAGNRLYALSQDGTAQVVQLSDAEGQLLAKNMVGETLQASPAVVGDSVYIRSDRHLWRFAAAGPSR